MFIVYHVVPIFHSPTLVPLYWLVKLGSHEIKSSSAVVTFSPLYLQIIFCSGRLLLLLVIHLETNSILF